MADKTTFIKLDRNIINWRWFKNPKILSVFIWMLVRANIKDASFRNETVKRGSFVTSNASIAEGCGLTIQNVRTALSNLEETGEITRNIRNHYQIVTIVNYELYQTAITKQIDQNDQPSQFRCISTNTTTNKQLTTNKEYKNKRMDYLKKESKKKKFVPSPSPLDGFGDVPNSERLKPIEEGTVDDIPEEYRDFCETYEEYWRFRNR